jgi:hypothetical protein
MRTYLICGNIEGKLDVLNVDYTKCARKANLMKSAHFGRTARARWRLASQSDYGKSMMWWTCWKLGKPPTEAALHARRQLSP